MKKTTQSYKKSKVVEVSGGDSMYQLRYEKSFETFGEEGIIATKYRTTEGISRKVFQLALKKNEFSLEALGKCMLAVDAGVEIENNRRANEPTKNTTVIDALYLRTNIVRHGWLTTYVSDGQYYKPFVNDHGVSFITYNASERPAASKLLLNTTNNWPGPVMRSIKRHEVTVFMKEDIDEHWYSVFSDSFSFLNPFWHYTFDIEDLIDILYEDAPGNQCIKELRIHSHGNRSSIRMGRDNIDISDFDATGKSRPGTETNDLILALKEKMCRPGTIIFDACDAAKGNLLRNISRSLGPNITVKGFTGTGNPLTDGDISYENGVKQ